MAVNDLAHLLSSIFAPGPQLILMCRVAPNSKIVEREVAGGAEYTENLYVFSGGIFCGRI